MTDDRSSPVSGPAYAWTVERPSDPTFPRLCHTKAEADALVQFVNVSPAAIALPLYVGHAQSPDQPVAWIAFAGNGNIRFWTSDPHRSQREKERGLDLRAFTMAELIALISRIPVPAQSPDTSTLRPSRDLIAAALAERWPGDYAFGDPVEGANEMAFETADVVLSALLISSPLRAEEKS